MLSHLLTVCRWLGLAPACLLAAACLPSETPGGSRVLQQTTSDASSNSPPTITGSPRAAIMIGDVYVFTPRASDPDGDRLSFSIEHRPRWADFDSSTGRLSGQVLLGDEGVYGDIRISVSDGQSRSSLPSFSVTVTTSALGAITLNWTPPTTNSDGSTLIDLAGYNIYFGTASGRYTMHVRVRNPSVSTYVVENLLPDTYYVVATSYNSHGVESRYSNEAVKTVSAD